MLKTTEDVQIKFFRVTKLNSEINVDLNIVDNKMVIVGDNGLGKSTLMSLFYFTITCQWERLLQYNFESITISILDHELFFKKSELQLRKPVGTLVPYRISESTKTMRREIRKFMDNLMLEDDPEAYDRDLLAKYLSDRFEVPLSVIHKEIERFFNIRDSRLSRSEKFTNFESFVESTIKYRFIFMPTYRKIERDIFDNSQQRDEFTRRGIGIGAKHKARYAELIEFGMRDVDALIKNRSNEIRDRMTGEFSKLTTTYLSDIINESYRKVDPTILSDVSDNTILDILENIDEKVLTSEDRNRMWELLGEIRSSNFDKFSDSNLIIAHFLGKFISLQKVQELEEKQLVSLIDVCNSYLIGKRMDYDNKKYQVSLIKSLKDKEEVISFDNLSSGEKQIVSLFTNVYLNNLNQKFFLIIDEPELSISVPWQKRLLPDILNSQRCSGIFAITHSPFIFDNEFKYYAVDMGRFISE